MCTNIHLISASPFLFSVSLLDRVHESIVSAVSSEPFIPSPVRLSRHCRYHPTGPQPITCSGHSFLLPHCLTAITLHMHNPGSFQIAEKLPALLSSSELVPVPACCVVLVTVGGTVLAWLACCHCQAIFVMSFLLVVCPVGLRQPPPLQPAAPASQSMTILPFPPLTPRATFTCTLR